MNSENRIPVAVDDDLPSAAQQLLEDIVSEIGKSASQQRAGKGETGTVAASGPRRFFPQGITLIDVIVSLGNDSVNVKIGGPGTSAAKALSLADGAGDCGFDTVVVGNGSAVSAHDHTILWKPSNGTTQRVTFNHEPNPLVAPYDGKYIDVPPVGLLTMVKDAARGFVHYDYEDVSAAGGEESRAATSKILIQ